MDGFDQDGAEYNNYEAQLSAVFSHYDAMRLSRLSLPAVGSMRSPALIFLGSGAVETFQCSN